jgi:outer membrane receptor protein involved in Fe transport
MSLYWRGLSVGLRNSPAGNYTLVFDKVNGVSEQPSQIDILNSPTRPKPRTNYYAGYVKDTWRASERLTVNLGLRIEQQHSFLKAQSREASPSFRRCSLRRHSRRLMLTWNSFVPRLGLAWDMGSKTVLKATYGRFANGLSDNFANSYNPFTNVTESFRWHDLLNTDGLSGRRGESRPERWRLSSASPGRTAQR